MSADTALTPWRLGGRALDRNGDTGHHERDAIGGGGDALIHRAEQVAEPEPDLRGRMHTLADFVRDDDERDAALAQDGGELVGVRQDGCVVTAPVQEIGDPDREAVDDDQIELWYQATTGPSEVERLLDGEPFGGPLRPMPGNAIPHVAVGGQGGGDESGAGGCRAAKGDGVTALAAPGATENEMRLVQ